MAVTLHQPEQPAEGAEGRTFEMDKFMGTWHVVWSTLPLWKDKKDVTITYAPLSSPTSTTSTSSQTTDLKFDDLVEYRKQSASATSKSSSIKGIDTLSSTSPNPHTFNWRGKGLLMAVTSRWQLLGYGANGGGDEVDDGQVRWAVTYFSKTLFTPAGIDIYLRQTLTTSDSPPSTSTSATVQTAPRASQDPQRALVAEIQAALVALGGEVGRMAEGGFLVGEKVD